MNYTVAMNSLEVWGQGYTASRTSNPDNRLAVRFGETVLLNNNPDAKPAYISWTPTKEDMEAEDWNVFDGYGDPAGPIHDETPRTFRGGTGTGSGWKKA